MKYKEGNFLALKDGSTVYVFAVDEMAKRYQVVNTEGEGTIRDISEREVYMFLT